jgi:hypothetical protein
MAFESTRAEVERLFAALRDAPEDDHELYLQIMQKLNELKAYGMPLPDDLVALEQRLEREFAAARRGDIVVERDKERPARRSKRP